MNISNILKLDTTPLRHKALAIAQAALDAIDTEQVIRSSISLDGNMMRIKDSKYDISKFRRIRVIGFGKAAASAAYTLEQILGDYISDGDVIDLESNATQCKRISVFHGSHPEPSLKNVDATAHVVEIAESSDESDLVIVLVSGGGSAMLVLPKSEYEQGKRLYGSYITSGGTIQQLNIVRKYLSLIKGGGLAKMLYPATVIGLIFSDVPGDHDDIVASGPTFHDSTTIEDAKRISSELDLGKYDLIETPKEGKYFERVTNITLVSNTTALDAMSAAARESDFEPTILSAELYDSAPEALEKMIAAARPHTAVIAGGEISMKARTGGTGGRNLYISLLALQRVADNQLFMALASDGMDNSDVAGAIADATTVASMKKAGIDPAKYIDDTDAYSFFKKINNTILTGPTGANVSDLYFLLTE